MNTQVISQLAPNGVLRAGINMSNFLLVTDQSPQGEPVGVSPDVAMKLAEILNVDCELIPYPGPGELADAIADHAWDIGNIAAETERAKSIRFSSPYCEIQATYLLPPDSAIDSIDGVDRPGHRIVVKQRSAYDLWLTENTKHAEIIRVANVNEAYERFDSDKLDALAGLRPKLLEQQALMPGSILLDESFTAVQQCIGCAHGKPEAADFINSQIRSWIGDGFIQGLIDKHGVNKKLAVASLA